MSADASYSLGVISNCNYIGGVKPRLIVPIDQHVHIVHLVTQQILNIVLLYYLCRYGIYVDGVLYCQFLGINFENLCAHQQEDIAPTVY